MVHALHALFQQILEPGGSFVMDIGGSWLPGMPARSIYQYKLLLRLCESGFYLAQDFYHHNPARLRRQPNGSRSGASGERRGEQCLVVHPSAIR
jgi:hypothetical protein